MLKTEPVAGKVAKLCSYTDQEGATSLYIPQPPTGSLPSVPKKKGLGVGERSGNLGDVLCEVAVLSMFLVIKIPKSKQTLRHEP